VYGACLCVPTFTSSSTYCAHAPGAGHASRPVGRLDTTDTPTGWGCRVREDPPPNFSRRFRSDGARPSADRHRRKLPSGRSPPADRSAPDALQSRVSLRTRDRRLHPEASETPAATGRMGSPRRRRPKAEPSPTARGHVRRRCGKLPVRGGVPTPPTQRQHRAEREAWRLWRDGGGVRSTGCPAVPAADVAAW